MIFILAEVCDPCYPLDWSTFEEYQEVQIAKWYENGAFIKQASECKDKMNAFIFNCVIKKISLLIAEMLKEW